MDDSRLQHLSRKKTCLRIKDVEIDNANLVKQTPQKKQYSKKPSKPHFIN